MTTLSIMICLIAIAIGSGLGFYLGLLVARARASTHLTEAVSAKASATARHEELSREHEKLQARLQERDEGLREREAEVHRLRERERAWNEAQKQVAEQRVQLRRDFENLANRIFDDKSDRFKKQSREEIEQILNPLRERLGDFRKNMEEAFGTQARERYALKEEIGKLTAANQTITTEAKNLTEALQGKSIVQGQWGELALEKLLEDSGLHRDKDYIVQGTGMGLHDDATGARQKPDVIVCLPEDKHIIIDAKVSLTHYAEYFNGPEHEKKEALKKFRESVRAHVDQLSERNYATTDGINSPDFVLMFMPMEGSLILLTCECPDMHAYAWKKQVAIVGPTTLSASLRIIASLWLLEKQNKNAEEIARIGGGLYDKISGFVDNMNEVGKQLDRARQTHDKAMAQLSTGRGNIIGRAEDMKRLGARATKSLSLSASDDEAGPAGDSADAYVAAPAMAAHRSDDH